MDGTSAGGRVKNRTVNLRNLVIVVADPSSYWRRAICGILRSFGANKLVEVENSTDLIRILSSQKIDLLLVDTLIRPHNWFKVAQMIRRNPNNENRTVPILLMCNETSEQIVKSSRDAGANMVVAKLMSPNILYDRLCWIAFHSRSFVDCPNYFGPDRRFKIEGYPGGVGRRKSDTATKVAEEVGPALVQDDIDSLFKAAQTESQNA
jgi:two-component system, chemotaxis family, chemotaxis protein CheY